MSATLTETFLIDLCFKKAYQAIKSRKRIVTTKKSTAKMHENTQSTVHETKIKFESVSFLAMFLKVMNAEMQRSKNTS